MPLHPGTSRRVIGENIREMEAAGRPRRQAIAASLREARQSGADIPPPPERHSGLRARVMERHGRRGSVTRDR